ncbi:hypothetical protein OT109_02750 [Phycisphaeraceae bacterium D3-23]
MSDNTRRVRIEGVDWIAFAPVLNLARAFRMALQPGKLVLALVAVLLLFGVGELLDLAWGDVAELPDGTEQGIYEATLDRQLGGLNMMMHSALSLDLGLGDAEYGRPTGVVGALRYVAIDTPTWLFKNHPWFAAVFGLIKLLVVGLFGGAICRMSATQACTGKTISAVEALRYTTQRLMWFVATPLMPALLIAVLAGLLALAGLVFFNAPVLDVVGAVVFGLLLVVGLLITLVGIGLVLGVPLMIPCLAVEGTDGFDAVSRCYNYVFFRPWHYALYIVSMIGFAAVSYAVVAAVASATVGATDYFVGAGGIAVMDEVSVDDLTRYDVVSAEATSPFLAAELDGEVEGTPAVASWIVAQWVRLVWALVAAFMLSLYFCMTTWVYLLLRHTADGTPMDDCDTGEGDVLWAKTPEPASAKNESSAAAPPKAEPGSDAAAGAPAGG